MRSLNTAGHQQDPGTTGEPAHLIPDTIAPAVARPAATGHSGRPAYSGLRHPGSAGTPLPSTRCMQRGAGRESQNDRRQYAGRSGRRVWPGGQLQVKMLREKKNRLPCGAGALLVASGGNKFHELPSVRYGAGCLARAPKNKLVPRVELITHTRFARGK